MCRAGFRRVGSWAMEPESEKPRSITEVSSGLPAIALGFRYNLLSCLGFILMPFGIAGLFGKDSKFAVELLVAGGLLVGIAKIVQSQERLVQLREWELTRRLKKEE